MSASELKPKQYEQLREMILQVAIDCTRQGVLRHDYARWLAEEQYPKIEDAATLGFDLSNEKAFQHRVIERAKALHSANEKLRGECERLHQEIDALVSRLAEAANRLDAVRAAEGGEDDG